MPSSRRSSRRCSPRSIPEGEIDRELFPTLAYFSASENWPFDVILAAGAALLVWLFLPDWYGVARYCAYLGIIAYVAVQFLRARRAQARARRSMQRLGLKPGRSYKLTLRELVKHRRPAATIH